MSGRSASASVIAEVAKDQNRPLHLFELWLDSGTVYLTDAYRAIAWGGNTYTAQGDLLNYEGLEETTELRVSTVTITLAGCDSAYLGLLLSNQYLHRRVVIRKAFLTSAEAVMVDPLPIFDGRADAPTFNDDPDTGTTTVTLAAASQWIDFERRRGRHTSDDEQRFHFPADKGMQYSSQNIADLKWGRA